MKKVRSLGFLGRDWVASEARDWLTWLPPVGEQTWLERQVSKYLYYVITPTQGDWISPLRLYLFAFWIQKLIWGLVFGRSSNGR